MEKNREHQLPAQGSSSKNNFKCLLHFYLFALCKCDARRPHATEYTEVRGPVAGTSSPTSTMWVPGMKLSSLQAWRQAPLYTEPSY